MIPQAKELFEQLPSLIGSIIIAWQERVDILHHLLISVGT